MIKFRENETAITESLKAYLGCEVVLANDTKAPIPEGDYVSYTIINPLVESNGGYSECDDGVKRKEYQQVWSFTTHSTDDTRSKVLALKAHEFFSETGFITLSEHGISAQLVRGITSRDNLLTYGFDYCNGFDVTFAMISEIGRQTDEGEIVSTSISYEGETITPTNPQDALAELNEKLQKRLDGE